MILVFGKTGQIALELQRSSDVLALGRDQANTVSCLCEEIELLPVL